MIRADAARVERQANARRLAAAGARRVVAAARAPAPPPPPPLTDADRVAYLDTAVCRLFGYEPLRWLRDPDGSLVLVVGPRPA